MPKFPQHLIVEILSRLPVKPLVRFKCVCKTWRSVIPDPEFAKLQLERAKENSNNVNCYRLLVSTWPPKSVDFEADCDGDVNNAVTELRYPDLVKGPPENEVLYVAILGSCNGLVCLLDENDSMFLWNPRTGDYKELPKPNASTFYGTYLSGLGYNSFTDDYVVLLGSHFTVRGSKEDIVELYTLKSRIWRRIEVPDLYGKYGIFWNGALYWVKEKEIGVSRVYVIVAFDIVEEKFREVLRLPDHWNSDNYFVSLGMSGNCSCAFVEHIETCFEAFVLNLNGIEASCTRLFSFPHDSFCGYANTPLCSTKNGEVVMDSDGWQIYLYNPKKRKSKCFRIENDADFESELYIESLVSPNN